MKKFIVILCLSFLLGAKVEENSNAPCYKADVVFLIDYSGSMSNTIPYYEPWLRATAGELPLSPELKAGLVFFSEDPCPIYCSITDNKGQLQEKILEGRSCASKQTFLESSLGFSYFLFNESEKERGEKVPRIIVIVTDMDVADPVQSCEYIHSYLSDVFFVVMEINALKDQATIKDLKDCLTRNGIHFDGFVWIYEDLLKQFDPCM